MSTLRTSPSCPQGRCVKTQRSGFIEVSRGRGVSQALTHDTWRIHMFLAGLFLAVAAPSASASDDLTELSLNELMNIEVTSVSKRAEPLFRAAAAIFVLSGDEIRRSGVRSIAEALRLAPGLQVRRTNAVSHTITARGFSGDKLEVLLDGRSVYTPLTSTVFWDVLDTYLGDIERIEVIRGPGATLWGANAVNGVINIVTRSAADTANIEVRGGGGNEERAFGAVRAGQRLGDAGHVRLYAKAFERDGAAQPDGSALRDGMRMQQSGFRFDGAPAQRQSLILSGQVYDGRQNSTGLAPANRPTLTGVSGGHLLSQWSYRTEGGGELGVQAYYDRYNRLIPEVFDETRDTVDLGFQHRIKLGQNHNIVWGSGVRFSRDETGGAPLAIIFAPADRTTRTYSAFVQDQVRLGADGELTLGGKFEYNDFTGFELQPGIRLGWALTEQLFTWGSVSRAVRTPNRIDHDVAIFCSQGLFNAGLCPAPGETLRIGNREFESEKMIAYEWGLRFSQSRHFSLDLNTFFNDYTDLKSTETSPPPFGRFQNQLQGESSGGELSVNWTPLEGLELRPFYAYLRLDVQARPGSTDTRTANTTEGSSPEQSAGLRAAYNPWPNVTVDGFVRYVDRLPALAVPHYTELNLRLAWKPWPAFEVALVGENLLDARHPETGTAASASQPAPRAGNELERSVFAEFRWTWR